MKPGYKTTEFFGMVAGFAIVVLVGFTVNDGSISFIMDPELVKWWLGASAVYSGSRAVAKK